MAHIAAEILKKSFKVKECSKLERKFPALYCAVFVVSMIGLNLGRVSNFLCVFGKPYARPKYAVIGRNDSSSVSVISSHLFNVSR